MAPFLLSNYFLLNLFLFLEKKVGVLRPPQVPPSAQSLHELQSAQFRNQCNRKSFTTYFLKCYRARGSIVSLNIQYLNIITKEAENVSLYLCDFFI